MVHEARAAATRRRAKRLEAEADADTAAAEDGPKARQWVADYRRVYTHGPLWRELAEAMGWAPLGWEQRKRIITALRRDGYLTFDDGIERSLDTGPGGPVTPPTDTVNEITAEDTAG